MKKYGERIHCEACNGTGIRERVVGYIVKRTEIRKCGKCVKGKRRMTTKELEADGQMTLFERSDEVKKGPNIGLPDG